MAETAAPPAEESKTATNGAGAVPQRLEGQQTAGGAASSSRQPACWNAAFWSYPQHAALQFASEADLDDAIDLLWNDSELRGVPRVHVGDNTMIVPAEAVDLFQRKVRHFVVRPVFAAGDLSPEEANSFRRGTSSR